jgi:hypothetical protein
MSEFHACSLGLGAILGLVDTSSWDCYRSMFPKL